MNEKTHVCAYCGAPATHQFKNGKWCCQENRNLCPEMRRIRVEKSKLVHQRFKEKFGDAKAHKGQTLGINPTHITKYPSRGDHICVYCGGHADYQLKDGRWCCQPHHNSCPTRCHQAGIKGNKNYAKQWMNESPSHRKARMAALHRPETHAKATATRQRHVREGLIQPSWVGRHHTEESKRKLRLACINRINRKKLGKFTPNFSKTACAYIDQLNESRGWHLQHALNGGEVEFDGYFVDGYDKELNVVFEYDERRHYDEDGHLLPRDVERMRQIHQKTGCRFFRYDETLNRLYEIVDWESFAGVGELA